MASQIKKYITNAEIYERRWKEARDNGNVAGMYSYEHAYKENISEMKKEMEGMDPSSREYKKASQELSEQSEKHDQMYYQQRYNTYPNSKVEAYERLSAQNTRISKEMGNAAEKGQVERYEQLRDQYENNIGIQDDIGRELRADNIHYNDVGRQSKQDIYSHDCTMRDKLNADIALREQKGKSVNALDRANANKYVNRVKSDEINLVKYNNNRAVEEMRERGASEEQIKAQEEKNMEAQEYVRKINR